jgi:hypothetical protein
MLKPECKGKLCLLVCAWLWVSGLLLMGKILKSLDASMPNIAAGVSHTDAVGSLQIFFLLYTAACFALYLLWRKTAVSNGRMKLS